jgi:multiple sugar transport system substrate-binding protein
LPSEPATRGNDPRVGEIFGMSRGVPASSAALAGVAYGTLTADEAAGRWFAEAETALAG